MNPASGGQSGPAGPAARRNNPDILASDDRLLLNEDAELESTPSTNDNNNQNNSNRGSANIGPGSISNTSNTSLSSTTNSSRGNVSQSGNLSLGGALSQRGTGASSSSQQQNPYFDSNVISERVKNLATQIYQELKRIISRCNYDEDILSGLMPLIVRVLESLDLALIENQQLQVELELCKDDNEQLVVMFEKEKAAKRAIDNKLIESEYAYEEERQQYQQKIEALDNTVKMFELKAKNASDQASRFEEKEAERKKEYNKLHDRYTELLKSHCDVVERVRHLVGNAEVANIGSINVTHHVVDGSDLSVGDSQQVGSSRNKNLQRSTDEVDNFDKATATRTKESLKSWNPDTELTLEDASLVVIEDVLGTRQQKSVGEGSSQNESDRATASEPDGEHEKESENDSIAYTSMEKEFRKLIQENKDLLNTKNALNVVKDDLIAEVDRLTNEVSMYEQAVEQLSGTKDQMKQKVSALDAELRKTKEELEKAKQKIRENNEEGVPYSQRKRFGRAEMAKVLMERNNYKEKFMELQDAVRYTELVRANKVETEKRSGLWKFFSNLFGAPPMPLAIGPGTGGPGQASLSRNTSPVVAYPGQAASIMASEQGASALALDQSGSLRGGFARFPNQRLSSNSDLIVLMDSDLNIDRSRTFKDANVVGGSRFNSESSGYIHAYGWSLPASSIKALTSRSSPDSGSNETELSLKFNKLPNLQVPIPQYCRPLTGDSLGMKIWCATAIDLSGGYAQTSQSESDASTLQRTDPDTSGSLVNISSSSTLRSPNQSALNELEQEVDMALKTDGPNQPKRDRPMLKTTSEMVYSALPVADDSEELSSCVWICSTQHSRSKITIIDIKTKPNELLDSFYIPTFLYSIKSIPGAKSGDTLGIIESSQNSKDEKKSSVTLNMLNELIANQEREFYRIIHVDPEAEIKLRKSRMEKRARESVSLDQTNQSIQVPGDKTELEQELSPTKRSQHSEDDAEISRILDNNVSVGISTLQKLNDFVAHTQPQTEGSVVEQAEEASDSSLPASSGAEPAADAANKDVKYYQPISTSLSTVWMGGKDCILYVHSAIGQWKDCVACVKLPDFILQICHFRGKVFVALADGSLCVFFRNVDTKQWEFSQYLLIDINLLSEASGDSSCLSDLTIPNIPPVAEVPPTTASPATSTSANLAQELQNSARRTSTPQQTPTHSARRTKVAGIRCLEIANKNLWVGYRNMVLIIDPITLKLRHSFSVVPQKDNQIRQLISMKDGVFCCLRSDLILRLYSSLKPYQHVQNIDIEPVVSRLISPKTFVISHITAMKVAGNTLWIGNAHGIILTIPCQLVPQISEAPLVGEESGKETPTAYVGYEESSSNLSIARFVPRCDISNAQISFHGHRDSVKFFVLSHELMLSGGQGYLDFRLDMDDQSKSISDKSHLILWQLPPK